MTYSSTHTTSHGETKAHGLGAALFSALLAVLWGSYTAFYFYEMLRVG
ncbi:hypothetical protein [Terricaulis sp.]